jgi:hypothetical protein
MDRRDKVLSNIAKAECRQICRKVIFSLQRMTDGMHSGDGGPLRNIWDEVCVQVQFQQSIFWDLYLDTVRMIIRAAVEKLDASRKQAIWLQTSAGMDWDYETDDNEDPAYCESDIVDYILDEYVLSEASNWTNKRIQEHQDSITVFD